MTIKELREYIDELIATNRIREDDYACFSEDLSSFEFPIELAIKNSGYGKTNNKVIFTCSGSDGMS